MFAYRPGQEGPLRCLDTMLRERWEEMQEANRAEIKRRKKGGVPLDDGDGPITASDTYDAEKDFEKIFVSIRAVSRRDIMETDIRIREIAEDTENKTEAMARLRSDLDTFDCMRGFVRRSIARVVGLEDDDGPYELRGDPLSEEQVEFLDQCGLLFPLFAVSKSYQYLTGTQKKSYGLREPLTSQTVPLTAAPALSQGANSSDVMGAHNRPGLQAPNTKTILVPDGTPCVNPGLAKPSEPSMPLKAN